MDSLAALRGINTQEHNIQMNAGAVIAMDVMELILMDAQCHVRAILKKCAEVHGAILSTFYEKSIQRLW